MTLFEFVRRPITLIVQNVKSEKPNRLQQSEGRPDSRESQKERQRSGVRNSEEIKLLFGLCHGVVLKNTESYRTEK